MTLKPYLVLFAIIALVLAACTAPPEDAQRAEVVEEPESPEAPEELENQGSQDENTGNEENEELSHDDLPHEHEEGVAEDQMECHQMPNGEWMGDCPEDISEGQHAEVMDSEDMQQMQYEMVPINKEQSSFEFEGYGPGKSHIGTFDDWEGSLYMDNGAIVGGEGVIQTSSVNTGIGGLDSHLKNEDFFEVEKYPTIEIMSKKLEDGKLTADLTFRGVTKQIMFPVEITENSISTDFVLDTEPFGMPSGSTNKEVRIAFNFVK